MLRRLHPKLLASVEAVCQPSCLEPKTRRAGCCLNAGKLKTGLAHVSSQTAMEYETVYGANNYAPLPCVFSAADRITVTDPEGKRYMDFLSAYSAVNQGHCHPKIVGAAAEQMKKCTLSSKATPGAPIPFFACMGHAFSQPSAILCSRAFFNDQYGQFAKFVCDYFNVAKVVPMNTGAEAVETGLKLARKWGYKVKKIPEGQALVVVCKENFHGRTLGIISFSDDPESRDNYGDITDLVHVMEQYGDRICGFMV
eukprot:gene3562-4008_t